MHVLPHPVEDDHRVVEGVAEDGQQRGERRRGDGEADPGVHPDGDQQVVQHRDDRGHRHPPVAEVDRDDQPHQDEEHHQGDGRLLGDLFAPGGADQAVGDLIGGDAGPVRQGAADLGHLSAGERAGLHVDRVGADRRHDDVGHLRQAGPGDHALGVGDGGGGHRVRDAEVGPAAELDAEVEPAHQQAGDADGQYDGADHVPAAPPGQQVEDVLAVGDPDEGSERGSHQASSGVPWAAERSRRRRIGNESTPIRAGSTPDPRRPSP
ncbi:hypothetical protein SDC9_65431 [bioreactor metagenome]|uniref:Uncharacterized protein n=1 Tax=bioreactor metagenome TaxID=1076179 RepID=A0A644XXK0_9ZZZZ